MTTVVGTETTRSTVELSYIDLENQQSSAADQSMRESRPTRTRKNYRKPVLAVLCVSTLVLALSVGMVLRKQTTGDSEALDIHEVEKPSATEPEVSVTQPSSDENEIPAMALQEQDEHAEPGSHPGPIVVQIPTDQSEDSEEAALPQTIIERPSMEEEDESQEEVTDAILVNDSSSSSSPQDNPDEPLESHVGASTSQDSEEDTESNEWETLLSTLDSEDEEETASNSAQNNQDSLMTTYFGENGPTIYEPPFDTPAADLDRPDPTEISSFSSISLDKEGCGTLQGYVSDYLGFLKRWTKGLSLERP